MSKVGYHQIGGPSGLLARLQSFENHTGSMSAAWTTPNRDGREVYQIWSYSTLMAIYDPLNGTLYYNEHPYSVTTARQQTLIRAWTAHLSREYEVPCTTPLQILNVWLADTKEVPA